MKTTFKQYLKNKKFPKNLAVCGWLSPRGHFHLCRAFGHSYLERELKRNDEDMLNEGWIKITANAIFHRTWKCVMSKAQQSKLFDWAEATKNMKRYNEFMKEYEERTS